MWVRQTVLANVPEVRNEFSLCELMHSAALIVAQYLCAITELRLCNYHCTAMSYSARGAFDVLVVSPVQRSASELGLYF
jgi:hypothetical protein